MSPAAQVAFLDDVQRLLKEGLFVASYKYALLIALTELAVETDPRRQDADTLPVADIASKFIELYWNHSLPFGAGLSDGEGRVLWAAKGGQAEIITTVQHLRSTGHNNINAAKRSSAWPRAIRRTVRLLHQQPLWRLQRIGSGFLECLYEQQGPGTTTIRLKPGVRENLRRFHGLVVGLAQAEWARFVQSLPKNAPLLGQATDLHSFLFGSERSAHLRKLAPALADAQHGHCLYCGKPVYTGEVDHFVPWSRYPRDIGQNLVLAHSACNRHKRDYIAAEQHLEHWLERNDVHAATLAAGAEEAGILVDASSTVAIATWAYGECDRLGAGAWLQGSDVAPLQGSWRQLLAVPAPQYAGSR